MSSFKKYKDESRAEYGRDTIAGLTIEEIDCGSLQRIADATERMASNHAQLLAERDRLKRWLDEETQRRAHRDRQIVSLRGYITRLKKTERNRR